MQGLPCTRVKNHIYTYAGNEATPGLSLQIEDRQIRIK